MTKLLQLSLNVYLTLIYLLFFCKLHYKFFLMAPSSSKQGRSNNSDPSTYPKEYKLLAAVDCIIFGFYQNELKLLIFRREVEPLAGQWSLIGGLVGVHTSVYQAAQKILEDVTGLKKVFMEQLFTFGDAMRDPGARVISTAYWSLIRLNNLKKMEIEGHEAKWVSFDQLPILVLDHKNMANMAMNKLRENIRYHPIGFELLPPKFTLRELLTLYRAIHQRPVDNRNFRRKILATGLLNKLNQKDKSTSKKGSYLYAFNSEKYQELLTKGYIFDL